MLYFIWAYEAEKGKGHELEKFILEELEPYLRELPFFKTVNTYKRRVGLGHGPIFQTWIEISDLAAIDKWIEYVKNPPLDYKEIAKLRGSLTRNYNSSIYFRLQKEPRMFL